MPIILACIWWQRKGVILAFGFGTSLLTLHLILRPEVPIFNDVLRSLLFIIIAIFVAKLSQRESSYRISLKKITKELHKTNEYLNKLIDYANAPIVIWDNNKIIIRFNNAFQSLTGYSEEFILGKKIEILFPIRKQKQTLKIIEEVIRGQNWENTEILISCKNNEEKILLWNSASITNKKGETIATIAQGQDITLRKISEKEIKKKIKETTKELENAKAGLEKKIKERTQELELAKNHLEKKVAEKTKELQSRVDELERFHKVVIGRELKMIELKKRIKELENKLGNSKKK